MEQRNRLGALGYLPPLLLHALLLFVADGERGNFAAAGGSGDPCWGRQSQPVPVAKEQEEEEKGTASRSPTIPVFSPGPEGQGEESSEGSPQLRRSSRGHSEPDPCSGCGEAARGERESARPSLAPAVRLGAG